MIIRLDRPFLFAYGTWDKKARIENGAVLPHVFSRPTTEAYRDVRFWPRLNEFCIDQTMGPNAYVWGYLAARK